MSRSIDGQQPRVKKAEHSAASKRDRALWLLNELCEDSLEVPLDHVDALDRDGIIIDYGVSANFKELRDLIVELGT